jgi:hypothetical protein
MEKIELLGKLSPFQNKNVLLSDYQNSDDIIKQILKTHRRYENEYDKISPYFWKGSLKKSCKYIYNFLKNNIDYVIEPDTRQSVKSPAAIIATGYGDCKHYSLFFAGLLDSWRRSGKPINWAYRFANYKLFNRTPHHVFVVINPNTKNEVWCDAVLDSFNDHKPYINKIDKKFNEMALYSISGIGAKRRRGKNFLRSRMKKILEYRLNAFRRRGWDQPTSPRYNLYKRYLNKYNSLQTVSGWSDVNIQSVAGFGCCDGVGYTANGFEETTSIEGIGRRSRAERKAKRKARRERRRSGPNCKGRIAAKITLSPARRAFLLLVRINFKKLGVKIYKGLQDPNLAPKIYAKWCGLGGNANLLRSTATKAFMKAKRRGKVSGSFEGIGLAIESQIAIASAVLAALDPILKLVKGGGEDQQQSEQSLNGNFGQITL